MSHNNMQVLLNDIAFGIGSIREAKRMFSDQLAPEFSLFDYMRNDEMGLSNCIASLLDPRGTHGQSDLYLKSFFTHVVNQEQWSSDLSQCKVTTEKQVNNKRRIDIFLQFNDGIIGIENKPWAGDQKDQLLDYSTYLKSVAQNEKKWLLIYLCDEAPSTYSIPTEDWEKHISNGNAIECGFRRLNIWLQECSQKTKAQQVRVFIEELIKFTRKQIIGELDMSEENEAIKLITSSSKNIESAFDISNTINSIKLQLLSKFKLDLSVALGKQKYQLNWDPSMTDGQRRYSGFEVSFNEDQDILLRFEFNGLKLNELFWGICPKNKKAHDPEIWKSIYEFMISSKFGGDGNRSKVWPWYKEDTQDIFGIPLRDWNQDPRPWSAIHSGLGNGKTMAQCIVDLAVEIHQLFDGKMDLLKLKN